MKIKHLIIVNPVAGKKDRSGIIAASAEREIRDEEVEMTLTSCPGDATEIVKDRLSKLGDDEFLRIYACGGDGTISEVVTGMYLSGNKNCALGTVPIGSGNDFIKYFDEIPASSFRSFAEMSKAAYHPVDILTITDESSDKVRASLNIISFGFDAAVAKGMNKYRRMPLVSGSAAYDLSIVESMFKNRRHKFELTADGEAIESPKDDYLFVIAGNGRYYGGGFKASPLGNIQDGKLDLVKMSSLSIPKFLSIIGKFRQGRHLEEAKEYATHLTCESVRIAADHPIDGNIDGETVTMQNPVITVVPGAINLIIPEAKGTEI